MKTAQIVILGAVVTAGAIAGAYVYALDKKTRTLRSMLAPLYRINCPVVSVVIPTLQEEEYLTPLLASISNQTYANTETIIADSSNPDSKAKTADLIASWKDRIDITMVDAPPKNVSAGRNAGAAASQGEYLLFMDADCIMEPDYIEKMVADMERCHLAHGLDAYYDAEFWNTMKAFYLMTKPRMHTTGRGVMIRKSDFDQIGGYDENLDPATTKAREDLDLGIRVEQTWGNGSVYLDRNAVIAESHRRPIGAGFTSGRVWDHRGWRMGKSIDKLVLK